MKKKLFLIVVMIVVNIAMLQAQSHLNKTITVDIRNQSLKDALIKMGSEGDFKFSYNSKSVPKDSVVSILVENKRVLHVLRSVFNSTYDFKEVGNYVIIRRKIIATQNVVAKKVAVSDDYFITGFVVDEASGEKLGNTTIYEKMNLLSTMTDDEGYFSLKLKKKFSIAEISISKENYIDTTITIVKNHNQQITIALTEQTPVYVLRETETDTKGGIVVASANIIDNLFPEEKTWVGRLFISSKQKIQNLNLKKFYTTRTWQMSFIPPYSTHGRLNAQVVNKYSLNILGGYSGGTDVFEMAGIYNMNKKDVKYFQTAGVFNNVGGKVTGFQLAGVMNNVQDTVRGFQGAGILNTSASLVKGTQFSGIVSIAKSIEGVQLAGIANIAKGNVRGAQWAAIYNKAASISGIQVGLINVVTEKNTGSSFGLINISKGKNDRKRVGFIYRAPRKK